MSWGDLLKNLSMIKNRKGDPWNPVFHLLSTNQLTEVNAIFIFFIDLHYPEKILTLSDKNNSVKTLIRYQNNL